MFLFTSEVNQDLRFPRAGLVIPVIQKGVIEGKGSQL